MSMPKVMSWRETLRVRYVECDPMNVVHHSVYPVWMELARVELLRAQGAVYAELEKKGFLFMVARMSLRYRKPVYYDDQVHVDIEALPSSGVKIDHLYKLYKIDEAGKEQLVVTAETTVVCTTKDGKPQRIPERLIP